MVLRPLLAAVSLAALALAGCDGGQEADPPAAPADVAVAVSVGLAVGDVRLQVEVADDEAERAAGLRGRDGVPAGTGMVFRYPSARPVRFTMSRVTFPLTAVFAREGRVVAVEQMPPCAGTLAQCPTYGPDEPVDTVVEAAPPSLAGVAVGDPLRASRAQGGPGG